MHAEKLAKINLPKISTTASFIGVCTSALVLIPLICSATIKPIMDSIDKNKKSKDEKQDIEPIIQIPMPLQKRVNTFQSLPGLKNYSMKVGGV